MNKKAVALLSGGLDSRLAVKLMLEQGIELFAVNYVTLFCTCTPKNSCKLEARKAAEEYEVPLKVVSITNEFLEVVKNPKYGYGRGLNPCLDCRVLMFKQAKQFMSEVGASFIVTGEVLDERPMSQRRDTLRIIERDSGLERLVLRPLSAKILPVTIPEEQGVVDRERLLSIRGRSRKPQMKLAADFGMKDYPCPAGGCLLTDPGFAKRMRDLLHHNNNFTSGDVRLLKIGRHFRLSEACKIVVGRNHLENIKLESLAESGDWLIQVVGFPGPTTLLRGDANVALLEMACCITARYSDGGRAKKIEVNCQKLSEDKQEKLQKRVFVNSPAEDKALAKLRI